jgi:hypothetical protein
MQFFAFLMLWLESSRDNRRNSLFFFFSQNRKKKESKKDNIHVERRRGGERDRQIPKGEGYRRAVTARADALFRSSTRSNWLPKRPLLLLHPPTLFTRSYTSHPLYSVLVRRKRKKKPPSLSSLVKFKSRKQEDGFSSVWWHTSGEQRDRYFCSSLSLSFVRSPRFRVYV